MKQGQVALVTGGASGIGRGLSEEIGRRGVEVVIADRQLEAAESVAEGIVRGGGKAAAAELDVRDFDAFDALTRTTVERTGRLDFLFNNAGIGVGGDIDQFTLSDWYDVLDVNVRGVVHGIQCAYPRMIRQGSGHIVNTASVAGLIPAAGEASYTASKFAVVGLSKSLRIEAARHGVRASVVCPGVIRTPILTGGRYGRHHWGGVSNDEIMKLWEIGRPMEADRFARQCIDAVDRNEAIIVIPRWYKALWYLDRLSPSLSMKAWGALYRYVNDKLQEARGKSAS